MALFSSSRSGGTDFHDPRVSGSGSGLGDPPESSFWQTPAGIITLVVAIVVVLGAGAYVLSPWLAQRGIRLFGPSVVNTYSTELAQQKRVALSNGAQIILGPLSKLDVYEGDLEVELEGTGVFSVTPKPDGMFTVRALNTVTTVLGTDSATSDGTEFVVKAYEGDTATSIAVVKGRVRLGDVVILNTGNVADVANDGRTVVTFERPMGPFKGWVDGNLDFVETPLSVVAGDLKRWYPVDVWLSDTALARDTVTTSFPIDSLSTALRAISQGARVDVKRVGEQIRLSRARSIQP